MRKLFQRLIAALRTPFGRVVTVSGGVAGVAFIVRHLGLRAVVHALEAGAHWFPVVLTIELCMLGCTMMGLRSLYGRAGGRVPPRQYVRAGIIGYAVMGLVPAGRAVAEVTRATILSRWVGRKRAATAALELQGAALLANGLISIAATVAIAHAVGFSIITLAIAGNAAITLASGGTLIFLGQHRGVGRWIGRHVEGEHEQQRAAAPEAERSSPFGAIAWEFTGRVLQVIQNGVLVVAVGGALGLEAALSSEGIHLVGAAVGEVVPAQLGFTEANYTLFGKALHLDPAEAVAIPLLAHLAQLTWVLVGSLVPLVWPAPTMEGAATPEAPEGPEGTEGERA